MTKKGMIFSDVDGTLCFHQEAHGIREVGKNADGTVTVTDPATGKAYSAYDVSTNLYKVYVAVETQELGRQLRGLYDFVCVTGGRPSTVRSRSRFLDFADAIILENGGMIFDEDLRPNREWSAALEPERKFLPDVAEYLRDGGWTLDDRGRTSAIRVRKRDNPHKSREQFEILCKEIALPEELKKTLNIGNLDIILRSAGKGNAVRFLMHSRGCRASQTIGIGDDINDLDFLRVTGKKYVLSSSFAEVLDVARREGWHLSREPHFEGIHEVMRSILSS